MWSVVVGGLTELAKQWFATRKAKQEAEASYHMALAKGEQDWDIMAMKNSQFSWKDELITIIWFAPLVVAWFNQEQAMQWIEFVTKLPVWYQIGMFGIVSASFGLRWFFKKEGLKIKEHKS